ncbi:hypothetical protein pb186bvf_000045 [Paramecium bursaria]
MSQLIYDISSESAQSEHEDRLNYLEVPNLFQDTPLQQPFQKTEERLNKWKSDKENFNTLQINQTTQVRRYKQIENLRKSVQARKQCHVELDLPQLVSQIANRRSRGMSFQTYEPIINQRAGCIVKQVLRQPGKIVNQKRKP